MDCELWICDCEFVNLWLWICECELWLWICECAWQKKQNCELVLMDCELWTCELWLLIVNCEFVNLWVRIMIVNCGLAWQKNRIVNLCLWIVSCGLVIVNCQLWIVSFWICACKFECELWLLIVNLRGQKTKLWTCACGLWLVSLWVVNYCEFRDMVIAYKSLDNMFS